MAETTYTANNTVRESYIGAWGHVSWPAIFAGVALTLTVQILLSMLGTGIGMSTIDLQQSGLTPSGQALSLGAGLWWVVSFFLSLAIGGSVASHLAGGTTRTDGILHGLITWAVATLLGVYLVSSAVGNIVTGAGNVAGAALKTVGTGAMAAATAGAGQASDASASWDSIKNQVQATLMQKTGQAASQTGQTSQAGQKGDAFSGIQNYLDKGTDASPEDRQAVVDIIAQNTNVTKQEAEQRLTQLETQYKAAAEKVKQKAEQAKTDAKVAADKTAKVLAQVSLWGFLAFVLGAIAAALGGLAGSNVRLERVRT